MESCIHDTRVQRDTELKSYYVQFHSLNLNKVCGAFFTPGVLRSHKGNLPQPSVTYIIQYLERSGVRTAALSESR